MQFNLLIIKMLRLFSVTLFTCSFAFFSCQSDNKAAPLPADTAAPAIDTTTGLPIPQPNPWKNSTCDLLTDEEFCSVFNVEIKRDFANKRSLPDASYCLRTWKKPDWREREIAEEKNPNIAANPESALVIQIIDFGTSAVASTQFDQNKRDRINGYDTEVPGLGDGALWSPREGMLVVKVNHLFLQIKLDHADNANDNLPKAKEVAALAVKKM